MSTSCAVCFRATNMYLCPGCTGKLRRNLLGLPTFVGYLDDAAVGDIKLGEPTTVTSSDSVISGFSFNTRAADLAVSIRQTLITVAWRIARRYGLVISPPVTWHRTPDEYVYTARDYATFLAANIDKLAKQDDIADLYKTVENQIRRGLIVINRAVPKQFCGPCPSTITDHRHCTDCAGRNHDCGTRLMADPGAIEVLCPQCGRTHNVEALTTHLLARADHHRCTIPELHRVLRMLGEPVPLSTLYRWAEPKSTRRGSGQLKPAGYLRIDKKTIGITKKNDTDLALYRVSEARRRRTENLEAKIERRKRRMS